jgi:hypothetical protein
LLRIFLNDSPLETLNLAGTANGNMWANASTTMFLTQGINRIAYGALSKWKQRCATGLHSGPPGSGTITTYEAAALGNTVAGSAVRETNSTAPGRTDVGFVGQGSANYVQFNNVSVPTAGLYRMLVTYANDEVYSGSQGGPVFRFAQISVNGGTASTVYFNNTFSWSNWNTQEIDVSLNAGNNTIRFSNSTTSPTPTIDSGWIPVLASIQIALAL